jgi:putative ABC transport system permease protein
VQKLGVILKLFVKDVQKQKLRTFMTMFGIVWGTVSLIVLMSFGEGVFRHTRMQFRGLGERIAMVWPGSTKLPYQGLPKGRSLRIEPDAADLLVSQVENIERASPEFSRRVNLRVGRKTISGGIAGVYPEFGLMRNVIPESGRFINDIDQQYRKRTIFLGTNVRDDLFGEGALAVGQYVFVDAIPFLVVGVLQAKDQNSSYNSRDVDRVFIGSATYQATYGEKYPNNFVYQIKRSTAYSQTQTQVFKVLGSRYKFDPADTEALWIWDRNEDEEQMKPFFDGFRMFLGIVGIFTLIVGGIGTANIMYVVVKERTKEIGIKMALGATRFHIMSQILGEALILTFLGGMGGFLVAQLLISGFPLLELEEYVGNPVTAPWVVIASISALMTLGMMAGFFPARRAANLNPVQCLRL